MFDLKSFILLESRLLDSCNLGQLSCLWHGLVPCGWCAERSWFHLTGTKAGIYEHIVPERIWLQWAPPAIPDDHSGFSSPAQLGSGPAWLTDEQELCPVSSVAQLLCLRCSPEAEVGVGGCCELWGNLWISELAFLCHGCQGKQQPRKEESVPCMQIFNH